MLRLFMSFALIYNIYGLIVSNKYIGANAGNRLLKYNNKLNLDTVMVKRLIKGFESDENNYKNKLEDILTKDIKYDKKTYKPDSIEHDILSSMFSDTYKDMYTDKLVFQEFSNKIYKHVPYKLNHVIEGKCAFIGFYEDEVFKPYYSFVIEKPDIRPLAIKDVPMKLSCLNEKWLYLENIFYLE